MMATVFHGMALGGSLTVIATGIDPAQHDTAVWALVITSATGIVTQFLRARAERQREEQRHRFEMEDRRLSNAQRAVVTSGLAELTDQAVRSNKTA